MDLDGLRCVSQTNDNFYDHSASSQNYYENESQLAGFDGPAPDLTLLSPCEFCNRTFLPVSLNKHRRGCYKSWLKHRERDSRCGNNDKSSGGGGSGGLGSYGNEKPVLTIEQMLAKRRQRRLNWRLRHEEFLRAVHAARDYAEAVATGNPLPPPPPPIMEPDLKECPYCHRRFHEKAIERHTTRCKEQSIRNNREKPSYQTMEAKRRLAVRLYYQPNSRPNSCLSMTNPPTPTSLSRPSSRQTELDFGRQLESPSSLSYQGRHSSMSAIDRHDSHRNDKMSESLLDSLARQHIQSVGRRTPRRNSGSVNSRGGDSAGTVSGVPYGRHSHMSPAPPSSHTPTGHPSQPQPFPQHPIKRSTSCVSQLQRTPRHKLSQQQPNLAQGDQSVVYNHKPFSCSRSPSVEPPLLSGSRSKHQQQQQQLTRMYDHLSRSTQQLNSSNDGGSSGRASSTGLTRNNSRISNANPIVIPAAGCLHKTATSASLVQLASATEPVVKKSGHHSKTSHHRHSHSQKTATIKDEKSDCVLAATRPTDNSRHVHRKPSSTKISSSLVEKSVSMDNVSLPLRSSVTPTAIAKTDASQKRVRNEVQIKIKSHNTPQPPGSPQPVSSSIVAGSVPTSIHQNVSLQLSSDSLSTSKLHKVKDPNKSLLHISRKIDHKGEGASPPRTSVKYSSNCSLGKPQGDNSTGLVVSSTFGNNNQNNGDVATSQQQQQQQPSPQPASKNTRAVLIADQGGGGGNVKFRSTVSLQESLSRTEDGGRSAIRITAKPGEKVHFCQECGHRFSSKDAKFCCSCGCRRSSDMAHKT